MYMNENRMAFTTKWAAGGLLIGLSVALVGGCRARTEQNVGHKEQAMSYEIPQSITTEHKELHLQLEDAIKAGGRTGEAAKVVADRLHSHFEKEEEYALPPLGLLARIAEGRVSEEMKQSIKISDKLKQEMPKMLDEHRSIVAALDDLSKAAQSENNTAAVEFVTKLKMHAQNEEEVLYPAAILVGEYLKLRFSGELTQRIATHE